MTLGVEWRWGERHGAAASPGSTGLERGWRGRRVNEWVRRRWEDWSPGAPPLQPPRHPRALAPGTHLESKGASAGSSSARDRGSGKRSPVTLLPGYIRRRDRLNVAEAPLAGLTGVHSRAAAGPARVRVSSPRGRKVLFKGARPAAQAWHWRPSGPDSPRCSAGRAGPSVWERRAAAVAAAVAGATGDCNLFAVGRP